MAKRREPASEAIRLLRLLLVGTIILPLVLAVAGGYFSYRADVMQARGALEEAAAVAEENTVKVLDTHKLVAARIDDLLAGLTDAEIRAQEQALHEKLAQQVQDLPQVAAAWAIDGSGHELVSARVYPVNRDLDQSGRDDFRALQNSSLRNFIWALRARSLDQDSYQPYFTVAQRLQAPDGEFRGIAVVAVSGAYFGSFYRSLLPNTDDYAAGVFREDGAVLARYPPQARDARPPQRDDPIAAAIADKSVSGVIMDGPPFGADSRIIAYKRLADYPVYVAISRTQASIFHAWLESMAGYFLIGAPAAIGLVMLGFVALHRTRREQTALIRAHDAIAQRAAVESQLHQAQKMEALGQLCAGIAHDFNNLLTVISGNVALLQLRLKHYNLGIVEFMDSAMSGCERASQLATRLLSFSRNEPLNPRPTDVNAVIASMSDLLNRSLGSRISCETVFAASVWLVFVDSSQLENSLLNLALNARDAMSGSGRLTIETTNRSLDEVEVMDHPGILPGNYVEISVSDTGCGMSEEVRDKAFESFFTTKEPGKGTGLGLSQVSGFATRSGGSCVIESTLGQGTTIKIYLPRYSSAAVSTAPDMIVVENENQ